MILGYVIVGSLKDICTNAIEYRKRRFLNAFISQENQMFHYDARRNEKQQI